MDLPDDSMTFSVLFTAVWEGLSAWIVLVLPFALGIYAMRVAFRYIKRGSM